MCGIWFSLGFDPDPGHIDVVAHRGPDGFGWRRFDSIAGPVALGHRRLSIIDLSDAAQQPMAYAEERYWVVYNGEIYNYVELRAELEAAGYHCCFPHYFATLIKQRRFAALGRAMIERRIWRGVSLNLGIWGRVYSVSA